jgi:hypothetical protein
LDAGKVAVVAEWLKDAFSGLKLYHTEDSTTIGWFYRLDDGRELRHRVVVTKAFFDDHDIGAIPDRLTMWGLQTAMRRTGTGRVTVGTQGIQA